LGRASPLFGCERLLHNESLAKHDAFLLIETLSLLGHVEDPGLARTLIIDDGVLDPLVLSRSLDV
jgi:hypothetical protein